MNAKLLSRIRAILPRHRLKKLRHEGSSLRHETHTPKATAAQQTFGTFVAEVQGFLEAPLDLEILLAISDALGEEYREKLEASDIAMLPSYQHILPSGTEQGDFFTLDVGGSTLRIGVVKLSGDQPGVHPMQIHSIRSFTIDKSVRDLKGMVFFDWVADRLSDVLSEQDYIHSTRNGKVDMGLTWSFPVEQTSPRSGRLLPMGKGFCAAQGVENQDLGTLIKAACMSKNLAIETRAILNDSSAALLSQAYRDPSTRMSLVLGTGTNAAVFLPTSALGPSKFSSRDPIWHTNLPSHVLVNTEMSLFGRHIFPTTRWDQELNAAHPKPDLQPLEYLSTGRYLGEIVRIILLDAMRNHQLFQSQLPHRLDEPYALSTHLLAVFESDTDPLLAHASMALQKTHPLPLRAKPTLADLKAIRTISVAVTTRAAAYLACALHAMWRLRTKAEGFNLGDEKARITIACNGSIVEKFPNFKSRMQRFLDALVVANGSRSGIASGAKLGAVVLEVVGESSIEGAAVACACA